MPNKSNKHPRPAPTPMRQIGKVKRDNIFTPEQEQHIREIVFAMIRNPLYDSPGSRFDLADDFWREPDGTVPPKPLHGAFR